MYGGLLKKHINTGKSIEFTMLDQVWQEDTVFLSRAGSNFCICVSAEETGIYRGTSQGKTSVRPFLALFT